MIYSEHEKLHKVKDQSLAIGQFLEWLNQDKSYVICEWDENGYGYQPVRSRIESLLAEYFNIDLNKIEKEKREMLKKIREQNSNG